MTLNATETTFLTAAFYKFVDLPDYADRRAALLAFCEAHNVKGLILLAREGINSTIAGVPEDVHAVLAYLRQDPKLADLEHKESVSNKAPFHRMKVRLKKEIVTLGVDGISPTKRVGQYVKPEDWNDLISAPDVVVIDTRNDYEVEIGSFKGAVDPQIQSFSQLTDWVKHAKVLEAKNGQKPRVAMFCTGGIRCEKSTSLMLEHGFEDVYHLQGGILKYLELVPPEKSLWEGECFVFDERVSVGHGLTPGPHELCRACREPLPPGAKASDMFELGVSCPRCHDHTSEVQKNSARERQKQWEIAKARHTNHIGTPQRQERVAALLPVDAPILYSFRRCPYAMRARLALLSSGIRCEIREIALSQKPESMLAVSKHNLDRYKYPNRYDLPDGLANRQQGALFLSQLNVKLSQTACLMGPAWCWVDAAIAPFVRQFARTDRAWFDAQAWQPLQHWLTSFEDSDAYAEVMHKYKVWHPDAKPVSYPATPSMN